MNATITKRHPNTQATPRPGPQAAVPDIPDDTLRELGGRIASLGAAERRTLLRYVDYRLRVGC